MCIMLSANHITFLRVCPWLVTEHLLPSDNKCVVVLPAHLVEVNPQYITEMDSWKKSFVNKDELLEVKLNVIRKIWKMTVVGWN